MDTPELTGDMALSLPLDNGPEFAVLGVLEFNSALETVGISQPEIHAYLSSESIGGRLPANVAELHAPQESPELRLRRVLERECLRARAIAEELAPYGVPSGRIFSTGGWSRLRGLMTLRASVFGQRLHVLDDLEFSALGAAQIGARAATGHLGCHVGADNIRSVDPISDWIHEYGAIARELRLSLATS